MGAGIETLNNSNEGTFTGGATPAIDDYGDTTYSYYYNRYGAYKATTTTRTTSAW